MANNNNKIDLYENLPTGCCDEEGHELINGDRVRFLGFEGVVTFECGAFGIVFPTESPIDWDAFTEAMRSANLDPGARPSGRSPGTWTPRNASFPAYGASGRLLNTRKEKP